jgi:hypothetical protein
MPLTPHHGCIPVFLDGSTHYPAIPRDRQRSRPQGLPA